MLVLARSCLIGAGEFISVGKVAHFSHRSRQMLVCARSNIQLDNTKFDTEHGGDAKEDEHART